MDERCKNCMLLCKRLDPEDLPVRYNFSHLTPEEVLSQLEHDLRRYSSWHHLEIERMARSTGNQLAVLLSVNYEELDQEKYMVLIVQSEGEPGQATEVYFRYGVPDGCCHEPSARGLSTLVCELLQSLSESDWVATPLPKKVKR